MNLTGRPVYQKGQKRKSRGVARPPTAAEKRHRERVRALGCIVGPTNCSGRITTHHCGTGGGGRKDHMKVIGLCICHHTGALGVNGGIISRREWEQRFGTEAELLARVDRMLRHRVIGWDMGSPDGDVCVEGVHKDGKIHITRITQGGVCLTK